MGSGTLLRHRFRYMLAAIWIQQSSIKIRHEIENVYVFVYVKCVSFAFATTFILSIYCIQVCICVSVCAQINVTYVYTPFLHKFAARWYSLLHQFYAHSFIRKFNQLFSICECCCRADDGDGHWPINLLVRCMYSHHMQPLCANTIEIPFSTARAA